MTTRIDKELMTTLRRRIWELEEQIERLEMLHKQKTGAGEVKQG